MQCAIEQEKSEVVKFFIDETKMDTTKLDKVIKMH